MNYKKLQKKIIKILSRFGSKSQAVLTDSDGNTYNIEAVKLPIREKSDNEGELDDMTQVVGASRILFIPSVGVTDIKVEIDAIITVGNDDWIIDKYTDISPDFTTNLLYDATCSRS